MKNIRFKQIGLHLLLAAASFLLIAWGSISSLKVYSLYGKFVEVPSVYNMPESQFAEVLSDQGLRYEVIDSGAYNPNVCARCVIEQFPEASKQVKDNRKLYITLNPSHPGVVVLKDFRDNHIRTLVSFARATGLEIERLQYQSDIADGIILELQYQGKEVLANESLPKGSKLTVILGKKAGTLLSIPDVKGADLTRATDQILANGLNLGAVRVEDGSSFSSEIKYSVVKQLPQPTRRAIYTPGRAVELWLKKEN